MTDTSSLVRVATFNDGERVEATESCGGVLGGAVPAGTRGYVELTEHGLFSERVRVRFDNGYTETVAASRLRRASNWG